VLALIGNLDLMEIVVIGAGALMIFGRRLPEVAIRAATQIAKLRRSVAQVWREAGMEEELRKVRRNIEQDMPSTSHPGYAADRAFREIETKLKQPEPAAEEADSASAVEPPSTDDDDRESA